MNDFRLKNGKLDALLLKGILNGIKRDNNRVVLGPQIGADCALINFSEGLYAIGTDPITFDVSRPGYYAVHVNANDIAVAGAIPQFYTYTIIVPTGTLFSELETIIKDSVDTADSLGITLIGGHTEISDVVKRPLISISMFGKTVCDDMLPERIEEGDVVVQINPMAMEGTAILAEMFEDKLLESIGEEFISTAKNYIYDPGLSVVKPAVYAAKNLPVKLMHDPTEGGIISGVREMADRTDLGIKVFHDNIIITDETAEICGICGCDPLGLISSGALLAVFSKEGAQEALKHFEKEAYKCSIIAEFTEDTNYHMYMAEKDSLEPLVCFEVDELAKL